MPLLLSLLACNKSSVEDWSLVFSADACVRVDLDAEALSDALTVELWARGEAQRSDHLQPLVIWGGNFALVELDDGTTWFGDDALEDGAPSLVGVSDDAWHHVAGVREASGRVSLYVDGVLRAFANPTQGNPDTELLVGCWPGTSPSFDGALDELRLSSVARYDADFSPAFDKFELDDDTLGLWHFDEGEGSEAADATGRFPARVNGAAWIPTEDTLP